MKNVFEPLGSAAPLSVQSNPAFDDRILRAVERAIRRGWEDVVADPARRSLVGSVNENQLTDWLIDALHELLRSGAVEDFNPTVFERPHMSSEFADLSRKRRKRPDLILGLCGGIRQGVIHYRFDYLFVECKLIEQKGANVAKYLNEGVHRFVHGMYAWSMREGMMIGFVRSGQELPAALEAALAARDRIPGDQTRADDLHTSAELSPCPITRVPPRVYISVHERRWSYFAPRGLPGDITIRHLWLAAV